MFTTQMLLLVIGGGLLLIAIIGGGFEIHVVKIPKVEKVPRMISAVLGVIFVTLALNHPEPNVKDISISSPSLNDSKISFTISDSLGDQQVRASTIVFIDGQRRGMLTVDEHVPEAMLTVTESSPGRYSYVLDSTITFLVDGQQIEYTGNGQGMIDVKDNERFAPKYSISGNTMLLVLEEIQ